MNTEQYTKSAVSTRSNLKNFSSEENMLHCAMGCGTEAGELLDMFKKHMFYGKEMDFVNLKEELGDLMWYIANLCDIIGSSLNEIMEMNIAKLKKRYPNKFQQEKALFRDLNSERETLEQTKK